MDLSSLLARPDRRHPAPSGLEALDFGRTDPTWRALLREWRELARTASIFSAPEFFALQLPLAARGEPLLAVAHQQGRMTAALPLIRRGATLFPLQTDHSHHHDVLGDGHAMAPLLAGMVRAGGWDVLHMEQVPEGSPLATRFVAEARRAGCRVELRPDRRCPVFALPSFEDHLKAKHRANLRRCAKKAGRLEYERVTAADARALADGLHIEALAWKAAAGTAIESDPAVRRAYEEMTRLAADRGQLSLSFLRIGGERAAFLLGIEHGGTLHALKIGYDPTFAEVSAGHLVVWQAALDAERRGLVTFDFMGKVDEWKLRWTESTRGTATVLVYRPTVRGLVEFALHEVIKPRAPEALQLLAHRLVAAEA